MSFRSMHQSSRMRTPWHPFSAPWRVQAFSLCSLPWVGGRYRAEPIHWAAWCRPALLHSPVYLLNLQFWLVWIQWEAAAFLSVPILPAISDACWDLPKDLSNLIVAYEWNPAFCSIGNIIHIVMYKVFLTALEKNSHPYFSLLPDPWGDVKLLFIPWVRALFLPLHGERHHCSGSLPSLAFVFLWSHCSEGLREAPRAMPLHV